MHANKNDPLGYVLIYIYIYTVYIYIYIYIIHTGAGHIIRISSKS